MRVLLVVAAFGCAETTRIPVDDDPCDLFDDNTVCPACLSGETTCTFDDVSVTEASCRTCQAEIALYQQLCLDGVERITGEVTCRIGPIPEELR
ncbi:MAG: hypothetical protein AAF602_13480 [Myxococcota bacterium]